MSLKADRRIFVETVRYISSNVVEAGSGVILANPQPTGRGVGQAVNESAPIAVQPTGQSLTGAKFLGVSASDVVELDLTKYSRTALKATTQIVGEPYVIVQDGEVWTSKVSGTPAAQDTAYLQADGTFGNSQAGSLPAVGLFKSSKDSDGYALLYVKVA